MTSEEFGERIRAHREAKGLSVADMAAYLKLPARTLDAIERGALGELPPAAYAKGFTRAYAYAVGLSAEDIDAGLDALFLEDSHEDALAQFAPVGTTFMRNRGSDKMVAMLLILVLLILPLGAGWFVFTNYGDTILSMIRRPLTATSGVPAQAAPVHEVRPLPAAGQNTASENAAQSPVSPSVVSEAVPQPEQPASQTPQETPPQPANPVAVSTPATPPLPEREAATEAAAQTEQPVPVSGKHISISAREECWVRAVVDGGQPRRFTLPAGESRILEYKRSISLRLGNAGGVSIVHNGKPVALTAKRNERRTLEFP